MARLHQISRDALSLFAGGLTSLALLAATLGLREAACTTSTEYTKYTIRRHRPDLPLLTVKDLSFTVRRYWFRSLAIEVMNLSDK